jgi:hypothetical protein
MRRKLFGRTHSSNSYIVVERTRLGAYHQLISCFSSRSTYCPDAEHISIRGLSCDRPLRRQSFQMMFSGGQAEQTIHLVNLSATSVGISRSLVRWRDDETQTCNDRVPGNTRCLRLRSLYYQICLLTSISSSFPAIFCERLSSKWLSLSLTLIFLSFCGGWQDVEDKFWNSMRTEYRILAESLAFFQLKCKVQNGHIHYHYSHCSNATATAKCKISFQPHAL